MGNKCQVSPSDEHSPEYKWNHRDRLFVYYLEKLCRSSKETKALHKSFDASYLRDHYRSGCKINIPGKSCVLEVAVSCRRGKFVFQIRKFWRNKNIVVVRQTLHKISFALIVKKPTFHSILKSYHCVMRGRVKVLISCFGLGAKVFQK